MLLRFSIRNYKSFRDETYFSMEPAPRQTGLDYSIQKETIASKPYKGLSSAVVYGPNASGKTNLIGAMDTMKSIIIRGNIRNADVISSPNKAAFLLELIPNSRSNGEPTAFSIRFIEQGMLIDYSFSASLGKFLEKDADRKIVFERLSVNEKVVFSREERLHVDINPIPSKFLNAQITKQLDAAAAISASGLNDDELFLCNGFKSIFSKSLVSVITNWFDKKFIVIYRSDAIQIMHRYADPKENTIYVEKTVSDAAKEFGVTSNALGYKLDDDECALWSILENGKIAVRAEDFESYGTIRFANEFPLVIKAMLDGVTLVMDEFDASIHPMALMNIVTIFHNDDINRRHAQLIFNTHNPIFLDPTLFRRDEIKFVEREVQDGNSIHYSLSDFRTKDGIRKGEDYMKNYFVSRYGAIRDVDFSGVLEEIMDASEEVQNE